MALGYLVLCLILHKNQLKIIEIGQVYNINIDQLGLKSGLFVATVFPIMLVVAVIFLKDEKKKFSGNYEKIKLIDK